MQVKDVPSGLSRVAIVHLAPMLTFLKNRWWCYLVLPIFARSCRNFHSTPAICFIQPHRAGPDSLSWPTRLLGYRHYVNPCFRRHILPRHLQQMRHGEGRRERYMEKEL
uniref:Uncharacterized protein n=1 Tax=Eutreptiella gymnastica TaxID=73025 RepID=A0A7S4FG08_9EUGL